MIEIVQKSENEYEVLVRGARKTVHRVTLTPEFYRKLAIDSESPEKLIERSFQFLLEREPNTSILSRFDLSVIGTYFPEYETVIRERK